MQDLTGPTRRLLLGGAVALAAPCTLWASSPGAAPRPSLTFEVWRKGQRIGTHEVSFRGDAQDFVASIEAQFVVKVGPIPVFHYRHQAEETWRGGRFAELHSHTLSNGIGQQVSATATSQGVEIASGLRRLTAPADAHPMTHWNPAVLDGPLFNPQTGAMTHERVTRRDDQPLVLPNGRTEAATSYALAGDADITDWYLDGVWTALRGKVQDGSYVDYRRV